MEDKLTNMQVAKNIILNNLRANLNNINAAPVVVNEIYEIQNDDKALLEHCKALKKIFEDAVNELESKEV